MAWPHGDISNLVGQGWQRDSGESGAYVHLLNYLKRCKSFIEDRYKHLFKKIHISDKSRCQTKRIPFRKLHTIPTVDTIRHRKTQLTLLVPVNLHVKERVPT